MHIMAAIFTQRRLNALCQPLTISLMYLLWKKIIILLGVKNFSKGLPYTWYNGLVVILIMQKSK